MMFAIHVLQPVKRHMGVNLRGGNVRVAKDSLHGAQVSAVAHHVSGTTVTQHMRASVASGGRRRVYQLPDAIPCQSATATSKKQRRRTLPFCKHWPRGTEVYR